MRRANLALGLALLGALILPSAGQAGPTKGRIFTEPLTVKPSPDPSNPPDREFKLSCPKNFVALGGTMFRRDAGLEIRASEPKLAKGAWDFTVLNFSSQTLTANVQIRCIPDFHTIGPGELIDAKTEFKLLLAGETKQFSVKCPGRDIAVGLGFENPMVGRTEGIAAWVTQRFLLRRPTETIQNVGSEPLRFASVGLCLHERVKIGPDQVDLLLKSLNAKATLNPPSTTDVLLGRSCPKGPSFIQVLDTDFGPLDPGIFGFPGPQGTLFKQPAEIIDTNPSGKETIKGRTNCLEHEVL
jgi:hypothetical protein